MPGKFLLPHLITAVVFISVLGCGKMTTVAPSATTLPSFQCDANTTCLEEDQSLPSGLLQTLFQEEELDINDDIKRIDYTPGGVVFAWIPKECASSLESLKDIEATKYSTKLSMQFDGIPGSNVELNCELWFINNRGVIGSIVLDDFTLPDKLKISKTMPNAVFMGGSEKDTFIKEIFGSFTFTITGDNFEKDLGGLFSIPLASIWDDISVSKDVLAQGMTDESARPILMELFNPFQTTSKCRFRMPIRAAMS